MLYLAAAVSDFYVPSEKIVSDFELKSPSECTTNQTLFWKISRFKQQATHKISSDNPIDLRFEMVPKLLRPLVKYWVPEAFVVSFKVASCNLVFNLVVTKNVDKQKDQID